MTDSNDVTHQFIHCRRYGRLRPAEEHVDCPYCFGKLTDVETGSHERFCDYQEGEDPVSFGFPETLSKIRR